MESCGSNVRHLLDAVCQSAEPELYTSRSQPPYFAGQPPSWCTPRNGAVVICCGAEFIAFFVEVSLALSAWGPRVSLLFPTIHWTKQELKSRDIRMADLMNIVEIRGQPDASFTRTRDLIMNMAICANAQSSCTMRTTICDGKCAVYVAQALYVRRSKGCPTEQICSVWIEFLWNNSRWEKIWEN